MNKLKKLFLESKRFIYNISMSIFVIITMFSITIYFTFIAFFLLMFSRKRENVLLDQSYSKLVSDFFNDKKNKFDLIKMYFFLIFILISLLTFIGFFPIAFCIFIFSFNISYLIFDNVL